MAFLIFTLLVGCGKGNIKSDVVNNMADIRYNLFVGQAENISANLMCGMRENPYQADGIAKKTVQFGVITVTLKNRPTESVHYSLVAGKQSFAGVLEENPYNHTFMVDIEKIIDGEEGVYLTVEGVASNMQLMPISKDWAVQYDKALELGISALEEDIKSMYHKRKFKAECFLKIILDQNAINNPYYWCFGVTGEDGKKAVVIFDVESGEIITKQPRA